MKVSYSRYHGGETYEVEAVKPSRLALVKMPLDRYSQRRGSHAARRGEKMTIHLARPDEARLAFLAPGSLLFDHNGQRTHIDAACGAHPASRHYHDLDSERGRQLVKDARESPNAYQWCRKCFPEGGN